MTIITIGLVSLIVLVVLIIVFNAYFKKAGRGFALIRNGFGGQKVVLDGGCLSLPFLHAVERLSTNSITLTIHCDSERMLMTADHIPVDLVMQFVLRVQPTDEGVRQAARSVGAMNLNSEDLAALFKGLFIDAMQAEVSRRNLSELHQNRADLAAAVQARLGDRLAFAGLLLESGALVKLDQSALSALNDNNILHVQGLRRVAEIVSENRKKRAEIEASAEIAIRSTNLTETRDRVEFEQQQQTAEISLGESVSKLKAESESRMAIIAEQEARKSDEARLQRQRGVREYEIERDLALRQHEINSLKDAEEMQIASRIALSNKRADELKAEATLEETRGDVIRAQEKTQSEKERLAAKRKQEQAILHAQEQRDVDAITTSSVADNLLKKTSSEAEAAKLQAKADITTAQAKADGRSAIIAAENAMSEKIIRMQLERQKIETLPEIAEKISKPLEKIEGIRINHISGAGFGGKEGDRSRSPFTETMESILAMSVQLPALKKLGEEIGLDIDPNLATRASDALNRTRTDRRAQDDRDTPPSPDQTTKRDAKTNDG
ncbi:MAG: flotillin domain-containing protein [bacterium]